MPPEILPWDRFKERRYDRAPSEVPRWRELPPYHHSLRGRLRGNERPVLWRYHSEESDRRFNGKFIDDEGFHPSGYRIDGRFNRFNRENEGPFVHRDVRGHAWENDLFQNAFGRPHFANSRRYIDERGYFGKKDHFSENNQIDNGNDQRSLDRKSSFKWRSLREKSSESSLFRDSSVRLRNGNKPCNVDDRVPFEKKSLKRCSPDYGVFPKISNPDDLSGESCENGELTNSPSKLDRGSDQCSMDNQDIKQTSVESGEVLNLSGKLIDTCNGHSPVDDVLIFTSPLDLARTQKRLSKDDCNKSNGAKDVAKFEKESSLGSIDWKPYKWTRSKLETLDTPLRSPSGDAAAARATSAVSSEEGGERKKARLGWGEGLAKFEKKKVEGPVDDSATKPGFVGFVSVEEPSRASNDPADTSVGAVNSSPGAEDKACVKSSICDYDTAFSIGSPNLVHQQNTDGNQERESSSENVELISVANLTSSLTKLFQLEDSALFESSLLKSTDLNQLLMWRGVALKSLEVTESKIDSLENDLKILNSENYVGEEHSQVLNENVDISTSELVEPLGEVSGVLSSPVYGSLSSDTGEEVIDRILASNKATAIKAYELFDNLLLSDHCNSNVAKTSNVSSWKDNPRSMDKSAFKKRCGRLDERVNALKYRALQHLWEQDLQLLLKKNRTKSKKKLVISIRGPHGSNKKHRSFRFSNAGNASLVPTAETINCMGKLLSDSPAKRYRNFLKMPAIIPDKDSKSKFISNNGLVEDPRAMEKERAMINPWTKEEKEIFMDRFATFGKNFSKICLFLDHKTIADCVEFYYKYHKSDDFVNLKKKKADFADKGKSPYPINSYLVGSGKRLNCEINAASLDVLGEASEIAANADLALKTRLKNIRMREKLYEVDVSVNERETEAADVLAGICDSISSEPISSCVTSSFGLTNQRNCSYYESYSDDSCGEEREYNDWTNEERSSFIEAFASFDNDFELISRHVGTKSKDECKVFLCKARGRFGLDQIRVMSCGEEREDGDKDEGSEKEGACVVSSEKSSSKDNKDVLLSDTDLMELDKKNTKDCYQLENVIFNDLIGESYPVIGIEGDLNLENCVDMEPAIALDPKVILQKRGNGEAFSLVGSELADVAINIRRPQVEEQELVKENNSSDNIDENCLNDKQVEHIKGLKELNYADQELHTGVSSSNVDAGSSDVPVGCGITKILLDLKPALKESPGISQVADRSEDGISASRGISSSSENDVDRIYQKLYNKSTSVGSTQHESHSSVVYFGYPLQVGVKKEFNGDNPFLRRCSGSETSKRNSDVKLFGQILKSHPENINQKCPYTNNVDPDSVVRKCDENSCIRHENIPSKGFGVWDGNRTTMGFSSLLANYPTVFNNFTSTSTIEQQSTIVKSNNNDINLKGVSVFSSMEMISGNEIENYQFSGLRNPIGMVGTNVGLSDPMSAIKTHYPKAENYSGSPVANKTMVEEE